MRKSLLILAIIGMVAWTAFDFIYTTFSRDNDDDGELVLTNEEVEVGLAVGNQAPDFHLQTLTGERVQLSDYLGSPIMLNFWATWCPPCRAEMPDMQRFYEDTEITILAVNLTDTEHSNSDVDAFVKEHALTFPIPIDKAGDTSSLYDIQAIPTTFMIDQTGIIHDKSYGALTYEQMISAYQSMRY
ncbi:Peroxiredoxin [Amphibacillus marinus]|uniref:Peroxiredoxin n=1 Tax=Amphibacillus marinus TaxID=872970 RepID=A0A1H8IX38_9BACI|nr:redoxin domain-containing protein [Amphibacillus marinus]SEN72606.1 Peroxiredoxin [Amphibacillus marinus]